MAPSAFHHRANKSAGSVDLALLLLSRDGRRQRSSPDDDTSAADADWLCHDEEQSGDMELAVAAAFEDAVDWRPIR